jgi:bifunctional N-acetylglutamate synthase/kinase
VNEQASVHEVLVTLLRSLGSRKEIDQYLREFSDRESTKFAVVRIGEGLLEDRIQEIAGALSFLQRVRLFPIVLLDDTLALASELLSGEDSSGEVGDGTVTTQAVLRKARKVFERASLKLVSALQEQGTQARSILSGVFEVKQIESSRLGLVGEVTAVHLESIDACINAQHLPILTCLGETEGGQILRIPPETAFRTLALAVAPYKLIVLDREGGLYTQRLRTLVPAINLEEDYPEDASHLDLPSEKHELLAEAKHILDQLPATSSISVVDPAKIPAELFTHRGAGTLIRRGERILKRDALTKADEVQLRSLIEEAFGRSLDADYFVNKRMHAAYIADSFRAAALITMEGGVPYLDKFAVTRQAQGVGLGASVWNRIVRDHPRLIWRSRSGNPVNTWYFERADGAQRFKDWVVFWYGFSSVEEVGPLVQHVLDIAPSIVARP